MLKKGLYSALLVFFAAGGMAQSKKEQIETLTLMADSLRNALASSNNEFATFQAKANEEQSKLAAERDVLTASLNKELAKTTSLSEQLQILEANLKKSDETITIFKQAEEVMRQNHALTSDSLKSAMLVIQGLQANEEKSDQELSEAMRKLGEAQDKISRCETEKESLEAKIRSAGKSYVMNETAVNFHKAKGEIEKLIGEKNTEVQGVVFSYLDAKYGEFRSYLNVTPEDLAEMEETGSDNLGGVFLIEVRVNDFNSKFIQVEFIESYQEGAGAEGRSTSVWFFDKSTGIKYEWSNFIIESKKQGLLALMNKKLKTATFPEDCGLVSENIQDFSFSEYDLDRFTYANGQYVLSFNPDSNGMGPCETNIKCTLAEIKPFLNQKYFP